METTLFEVIFYDGRKFKVFCYGKNQKKRFRESLKEIKGQIKSVESMVSGINTISEFEKIIK